MRTLHILKLKCETVIVFPLSLLLSFWLSSSLPPFPLFLCLVIYLNPFYSLSSLFSPSLLLHVLPTSVCLSIRIQFTQTLSLSFSLEKNSFERNLWMITKLKHISQFPLSASFTQFRSGKRKRRNKSFWLRGRKKNNLIEIFCFNNTSFWCPLPLCE